MSSPLRTALFGFGLGGRVFHAPFLRAVPGYSLDLVVTSNAERAAQARERTDATVVATPDEVWALADELDLVVISTGNAAHVELAEAALDRGLHVVVDKPLCGDAATGRALAQRAAEVGRTLVTFQNRRWDGDFLTLRRVVANGSLGTVHRMESRFERWRPQPKGGWRESSSPADLPGLLYDLGSHLLDQALVLLGPVASVYVEAPVRRDGTRTDDDTFVALTHRSGAISHHWMSVMAAAEGPRFRVQGSGGGFEVMGLDPQEPALIGDPLAPPQWGSDAPWGLRAAGDLALLVDSNRHESRIAVDAGDYRLFWVQLRECLVNGSPSPVPIEQTLALLEVIDAARESAREGRTVVLPSAGA